MAAHSLDMSVRRGKAGRPATSRKKPDVGKARFRRFAIRETAPDGAAAGDCESLVAHLRQPVHDGRVVWQPAPDRLLYRLQAC